MATRTAMVGMMIHAYVEVEIEVPDNADRDTFQKAAEAKAKNVGLGQFEVYERDLMSVEEDGKTIYPDGSGDWKPLSDLQEKRPDETEDPYENDSVHGKKANE